MYKRLPYSVIDSKSTHQTFYKLNDLVEYLTSNEYNNKIKSAESESTYYIDAINSLYEKGLPALKDENYNSTNLNKLYSLEILDRTSVAVPFDDDFLNWVSKYDYLASTEEALVCCDGELLPGYKTGVPGSRLQAYTAVNTNFRHKEYLAYLKDLKGFGNLTVATTIYPNVIVIGKKKNSTPVRIEYVNSVDDPIVESNTNIIDVKPGVDVDLLESVKLSAGQLNYIVYIVRENATLRLTRSTHSRSDGWGLMDSVFICYPNSKVEINVKNGGSVHNQENFYVQLTEDSTCIINGKNRLHKGQNLHNLVTVDSESKNNTCDVNIKTVSNDFTTSSFIGRFNVNEHSEGFKGNMLNPNLMLSPTSTMNTRPILDIKTKEIECKHGCTISTVDENLMYYLQSRSISKGKAFDLLVDSFLC